MRTPVLHLLLLLFALLIQSCGGGGGGSSSNSGTTTPTPLTVDASSFVNKGAADLANFRVPDLRYIIGTGGYASIPETLAVADFERSGQYSAFVVGEKTINGTKRTRSFFLKFDSAHNVWIDISNELFSDPTLELATDRIACNDPRQGLVTKFNSDDRPDVYLVCADPGGSGVSQKMYISSGIGGKYVRHDTNFIADGTSASIALLDADQNVDIVTTHQGKVARIFGTGGFGSVNWLNTLQLVADYPNSLPFPKVFSSSINSVFLIPRNGVVYLLAGGYGAPQNEIVAFKTSQGFMVEDSYRKILLSSSGIENKIDYFEFNQRGYVLALDLNNANAFVYWIAPPSYLAPSTWSSQTLHTLSGGPFTNQSGNWPSQFLVQQQGGLPYLYAYDAGCSSNPVQFATDSRCGYSLQLNPNSFTPIN
jgi:hypothetical protein